MHDECWLARGGARAQRPAREKRAKEASFITSSNPTRLWVAAGGPCAVRHVSTLQHHPTHTRYLLVGQEIVDESLALGGNRLKDVVALVVLALRVRNIQPGQHHRANLQRLHDFLQMHAPGLGLFADKVV